MKNRNIIFKMKISKVTDYAALMHNLHHKVCLKYAEQLMRIKVKNKWQFNSKNVDYYSASQGALSWQPQLENYARDVLRYALPL